MNRDSIKIYQGMIRNLEQWRDEAGDETSRLAYQEKINQQKRFIEKIERGESA